jgi:hypothetical protein
MYSLDPGVIPIVSSHQKQCGKITFASVAAVDANGQLEVRSLAKQLNYVLSNKRPTPSTTLETADAVILKFNGKYDLNAPSPDFVQPSQVQRLK